MPIKAIDPTKPILGYTLKQRLGSGGYGEVWAAEAPGGLPKAVKFIFGYHDEKRAQTELKSLNRIRSVRHPFLLSLERIDVVDGQMIVISELADMCLKTRFEECVDSGLNGIPRAELMSYLREAAGALDFISEEFKLQHLDVKPENLLLVSGHIKVADFGLVKDIHDGTQSLMSGLTPAYAPPELFDGRPSKASDQYSLAILFQELLTGARPFDGMTAAQLASQHLKERPNLKPLPREDQATVARALSKDPELRFPNCTAMVDALSSDRPQAATPKPRTRTKLREGKRRRRASKNSTLTLTAGTRQFAISPTDTVKLPKLEYQIEDARFRPTLFVAVGHTGTKIAKKIRGRLNERNGDRELLPAIQFLCLDTDADHISDACNSFQEDSLTRMEVFPMPLRRPEEYREDARMHLAWLSRRWIYNVPKSLRTEGIRPLGRLAMATHIDELAVRLRQILSDLLKPEHLATTSETLELDAGSMPRVVILGASSGGTCSGMAIDLAYVVRAILRQLGVTNEDVLGVFTNSSTNRAQQRELSIANSLAFLNELYHFSCVEEYPGDESCGIPASTDGTTTFASTYLIDLGDDLEDHVFDEKLDSVAEYLYLASATTCSTFLDNCRRAETESSGLPLRSFGLSQSNSSSASDLVVDATEILGRQIATDWTTGEPAEGFDADQIARSILEKQSATLEPIVSRVHEALDHVLKDSIGSTKRLLSENFDPEDRDHSKARIEQAINDTFGFGKDSDGTPLTFAVDALCKHFVSSSVPQITEDILGIIDSPGPRIAGASQVAAAIKKSLDNRRCQLEEHIATIVEQLDQRFQILLTPKTLVDENVEPFFVAWSQAILQRFTLESTLRLSKATMFAVSAANESIDELRSQFDHATSYRRSSDNETRSEEEAVDDLASEFHQRVVSRLRERLPRLANRVEQQLQHNLLDQNGGMRSVLANQELRSQFQNQFHEATRITVVEQLKEIPLDELFDEQLTQSQFAEWMAENSNPQLVESGGATRALHTFPRRSKPPETLSAEIEKHLEQSPTLIPATVGEAVTLVEAERVPLDNVVMHLLKNRPDSIEYASRLHTRTDIAWTHISSMR